LCSFDPRLVHFTDRLALRDYAVARLGSGCVPTLLRQGDSVAAFADLRGPFVLKGNHGWGWNLFVEPGDTLSESQMETAQGWLQSSFADPTAVGRAQWAYRWARPLLLAEEMLPGPPWDYKLFSFYGEVAMIQVDLDRFGNHRRALVDREWRPLDATLAYPWPALEEVPRPSNLATMLEWTKLLSHDIDFVRVDLYDLGSRVLVGELTAYPGAGTRAFVPATFDRWLGDQWPAPAGGPSLSGDKSSCFR
jgi:hypothetical protein